MKNESHDWLFLLKVVQPWPLFHLFSGFQASVQFFQVSVKNYHLVAMLGFKLTSY